MVKLAENSEEINSKELEILDNFIGDEEDNKFYDRNDTEFCDLVDESCEYSDEEDDIDIDTELFNRRKNNKYSKNMKDLADEVGSDVDDLKNQMSRFKELNKSLRRNENANSTASFISKELKSLDDQGLANVLRNIIFSSDIDWNYATKMVNKFMPEVTLNEEFEIDECDEDLIEDLIENIESDGKFIEKACKQVRDLDGFLTDYTMYKNIETGEYVFVFGDKDIYKPEDGEYNWSCDTEKEAWEWFNDYQEDEE